ncbi:hypothetical protein PZ61_0235460 [Streptomyces sp. MNU77]|uniref:helix-turn-helix domain-containing protein n=1 Tax=Streptomyces sp. MNU77 TaxID=1573406 RepID=UPI0006964296|nr:helix-turn-helix domain-containing protein [Streptomyces sp. MNU77]OLO25742.1 hypothetical protein PZ61_0235460 [Streptomyces sp. MNU77]
MSDGGSGRARTRAGATVDVDAVLRLIDELAERDTAPEALLARVAAALGRTVGIRTAHDEEYAATPDGPHPAPRQPPHAVSRELAGTGRVWVDARGLATTGAELSLLLRRLAIAAKVAFLTHASPTADDVALRSVVDHRLDTATRARLWLRLGVKETATTTVFALRGPAGAVRTFTEGVRPHAPVVLHTPMDDVHLVLARDLAPDTVPGVPVGTLASFCGPRPVLAAPEAWRLARLALRFARPSPRGNGPYGLEEAVLVDGSRLGGFALLAETLSAGQITACPDVRALDRLVDEYGEDMLACLEAVAATESLRKAARVLHRHHNSVAYRVERAERHLDFRFTEPYGRPRLFLALVLRRLRESGRPGGPVGAPTAPTGR